MSSTYVLFSNLINLDFLFSFSASHNAPQPNIKMLQTGDRREHPSHIPDHLPPYPDPHTYIKTSVSVPDLYPPIVVYNLPPYTRSSTSLP